MLHTRLHLQLFVTEGQTGEAWASCNKTNSLPEIREHQERIARIFVVWLVKNKNCSRLFSSSQNIMLLFLSMFLNPMLLKGVGVCVC